jgi:hypothetical protein
MLDAALKNITLTGFVASALRTKPLLDGFFGALRCGPNIPGVSA